MKEYEKPIVEVNSELAEGVYAASGGPQCNSPTRNGVWKAPDYSDWAGKTRSYDDQFGCLGCPAYTATGCGLQSHYVDSNYASSYEVDNGNRKPGWEDKGYGAGDDVTDWNVGNPTP